MATRMRIGEVAQRLGVTRETVREWVSKGILSASRTPTDRLLFDESVVESLVQGERQLPVAPPSRPPNPEPRADERSHTPAWTQLSPWDTDVASVRAELTIDELNAEREQRMEARARERQLRERGEQQTKRQEAERQRLVSNKTRVFQSLYVESAFRAQVAAAIETFATPERVPAWLSDEQQYGLIATHAEKIVEELRAQARREYEADKRAETARARAEAEKLAEQIRSLMQPPAANTAATRPPPLTVSEALRRRRRT